MEETLYQGSKDVFLAKVRAKFDSVEDQALKSTRALQDYTLVSADPNIQSMYTLVSNVTDEGDRAVFRHVGVTGVQQLGSRFAGGLFPDAQFLRGYETAIFDPDSQVAGKFKVPDEREDKEGKEYKTILNRAQKLLYEIDRVNMADIFELWNQAFVQPTAYPTRFAAKGNQGLDGNYTNLNERLISTQHARADAGTTISNAVNVSGNSAPFSDTAYWSAREQGATFVDDIGKAMPMFGGKVTIIAPPANGLIRLAKEIDKSEWKTQTTNNDINIHFSEFTAVKTSPFLLKSYYTAGIANTNAWFLMDDTVRDPEMGTMFVKITFVPLKSNVYYSNENRAVIYDVAEEYVYAWLDWRNVIGSNGLNTTYSS